MTVRRPAKVLSQTVYVVLAASLLACQSSTSAQEANNADIDTTRVVPAPEARTSPMAIAAGTLEDGTYVKVVYSSPRKRGREIFGGLVPYGEVWRTGANEATELTVTNAVKLGGHVVPAGTYSMFTIPGERQWTIIINRNLGQWGAYDYESEADLIRFNVPVLVSDLMHEAFTISIDDADNHTIRLNWDTVAIAISIEMSR